eukprot:11016699-Lingulodinium_polyedra.AAC.1
MGWMRRATCLHPSSSRKDRGRSRTVKTWRPSLSHRAKRRYRHPSPRLGRPRPSSRESSPRCPRPPWRPGS